MSEQTEIKLENLPIHKLRTMCKEEGIEFKAKDKKVALIAMLKAGETIHKKREVVRAPVLKPKTEAASIVPILPEEIRPQLEALKSDGLRWDINESEGTVRFHRDISVTCNLDIPAHSILSTARESFAKRRVDVSGKREPGEPVEWRR